jgi:exodeoxyribonuclease VII small subunit
MAKKDDGSISPKYHELSVRLDEVTAKLQDPDIDVDDAVKYYEEAVDLIAKLEECLEQAQNQITEVSSKFMKDA